MEKHKKARLGIYLAQRGREAEETEIIDAIEAAEKLYHACALDLFSNEEKIKTYLEKMSLVHSDCIQGLYFPVDIAYNENFIFNAETRDNLIDFGLDAEEIDAENEEAAAEFKKDFDKFSSELHALLHRFQILPEVEPEEASEEELGRALYIINKAAKHFRDAKRSLFSGAKDEEEDNPDYGEFEPMELEDVHLEGLTPASITEHNPHLIIAWCSVYEAELYKIKRRILVAREPYAAQSIEKTGRTYWMYRVGDYTFHLPAAGEIRNLEIEKKPILLISAKSTFELSPENIEFALKTTTAATK